jgi:hypothetical protein
MNSNPFTHGTTVVDLDRPSSFNPISLDYDWTIVFNDSSSKPSFDNDEVVEGVAKEKRFLTKQLENFNLIGLRACHGLNV